MGHKQWVSVETSGGSTSESCGVALGVLGLVQSWSREAADRGYIARPLSASELMQVLRASASDVTPSDDPVADADGLGPPDGLRPGRPPRAQQMIAAGNVPPEAWFDEPRWYSLYDPSQGGAIDVDGPRRGAARELVRLGARVGGGAGRRADRRAVPDGRVRHETAPRDGALGSLPLSAIQQAFYEAAFAIDDNRNSNQKHLPSTEQYTVTFRLRVSDSNGRHGEERRTVFAHRDPTGSRASRCDRTRTAPTPPAASSWPTSKDRDTWR